MDIFIDIEDMVGSEDLKDLVRDALEDSIRKNIAAAVEQYFKVNELVIRNRIRQSLDDTELGER